MIRFFIVFFLFITTIAKAQPDTLLLKSLETKARSFYAKDYDSSRYFANQILKECKIADQKDFHAFALNWIGITYMQVGQPDSAEYYYDKTIAYGVKSGEKSQSHKALFNKSINQRIQGKFEESVVSAYIALNGFANTNDSIGVAHAKYQIATCFIELERYDDAIEILDGVVEVYEKLPNKWSLSNTYNTYGASYFKLNKLDSARNNFNKAIEIRLAMGGKDYCGSAFNNLANIFSKQNQIDSSKYYHEKSITAYTNLKDKNGLGIAYVDYASLLTDKLGQPQEALEFIKKQNK